MNKSCLFKILYYLSFLLFILILIFASPLYMDGEGIINVLVVLINILLTIIFIIKSIKIKLENVNLIFPLIYLIFLGIVVILVFSMNNKLILKNIHFNYYGTIVLFNYLLLNLYSVLSCFKSKSN